MTILQAGSRGDAVFSLQKALRALGYTTPEDGNFEVNTKAAVLHFQSSNNLTLDGKVGPQTMAALKAAVTGEPIPTPQSKQPPRTTTTVRRSSNIEPPIKTPEEGMSYTKIAIYAVAGLVGSFILMKLLRRR